MKLEDRPQVVVETRVEAPAAAIWAVATDLTRMGEWSSENRGGTWLDGAEGPTLGARFRGRNRHPAIGEWETVAVVDRFEPNRFLGWRLGEESAPAASWSFEIVEDGDGCLLRQCCRLGPGPSGLSAAIERMPDKEDRIIARRLDEHRSNMEATVAGIKRSAEEASR
ncbi:MAG TPA: SRPBCC family protein [Acidimicrobiales bacterium]|nr:SRPBCC family protein [Acidimicrobiales bacterium]